MVTENLSWVDGNSCGSKGLSAIVARGADPLRRRQQQPYFCGRCAGTSAVPAREAAKQVQGCGGLRCEHGRQRHIARVGARDL